MKIKGIKKKTIIELTAKEIETLDYMLDLANEEGKTSQFSKEISAFYKKYLNLSIPKKE